MRTMIIGSDGQLGSDLCRVLSGELVPLTHQDIEVCDLASIDAAVEKHRPELVVNTAAYNQVDRAEQDPGPAIATNMLGTRNLALACAQWDIDLLHVSTDYVFRGDKSEPYTEEDLPDPLSVYGTTKLAGEYFVKALAPRWYVIRTTGLFGIAGSLPGKRNFVETMLRLADQHQALNVVGDQRISPTYTFDLAQAIEEVTKRRAYGLFHITNSGACSWFEFARAIFEEAGRSPDLSETTSAEFGAAARRPPYSVLANEALERLGVPRLRSWREGLQAYLVERGVAR